MNDIYSIKHFNLWCVIDNRFKFKKKIFTRVRFVVILKEVNLRSSNIRRILSLFERDQMIGYWVPK